MKFASLMIRGIPLLMTCSCIQHLTARAAVINVSPGDSYTKIQAAQPGDEVVIAPGTYTFRVYFSRRPSPTSPKSIRAQDEANLTIGIFGSPLVDNAPGSYS